MLVSRRWRSRAAFASMARVPRIKWPRVVFLIAGMLPISIAMTNTGLAQRLGDALVQMAGPWLLGLIAGFFVITVAITQVIGGQVVRR